MYSAKVTLKFDSTWERTRGIYDEEMIPEEHITFECPAEDLNSIQLFQFFAKFAGAMGHNEAGIAKGACYVAFNEMRTTEEMRKTADEYDLKLIEDYRDEVCKLEAEIRDLKAKLSRLENPDAEQYLPEEMNAMCSKAEEDNKLETLKKLKNAYKVCSTCGDKYGTYHNRVSSWWHDKCDVCGKTNVPVTEARDFSFLKKGIEELSK